jgi:hypothetical protein
MATPVVNSSSIAPIVIGMRVWVRSRRWPLRSTRARGSTRGHVVVDWIRRGNVVEHLLCP